MMFFDAEFISELGRAWGAGMLAATGKGLLLLGLALTASWMLRRRAAAARHFVWTLAVCGLVALPLLSMVVPAWRVEALPPIDVTLGSPETRAETTEVAFEPGGDHVLTSLRAVPFESTGQSPNAFVYDPTFNVRSANDATRSNGWFALSDHEHAVEQETLAAGWPTFFSELKSNASQWHPAVWALLVWEFGAMLVAAWFAMGFWRVRSLQKKSQRVHDDDLLQLVDYLSERAGLRRAPTLLWSDQSLTPMTWGIRNSVILLPREAQAWSVDRRHDVLMHELAHVQRKDILTQLLAQAACVFFWFHPLPWLAAGRMRLERERACDDRVLMAGSRASTYASHLLEMARSLRSEPTLATASVAMARKSQLGERMESLLDEKHRGRAMGRLSRALVMLLAVAILVPLAAMAPVQRTADAAPAYDEKAHAHGQVAAPRAPRGAFPSVPRAEAHTHALPSPAPVPRTFTVAQGSRVSGTVDIGQNGKGLRLTSGRMWRGDMEDSDDYELAWDNGSFTWREDDYELRVEIEGRVRFAETEDDVEWMEDGSYFELEEERGRDRRRLEVETDRDGNLERRYFEGRKELEFDADAREWFGKALPAFLTQSGVAVTPRITRWVAEDGVDGTLDRIDEIEGDSGRLRHWTALLEHDALSTEDRRRVAKAFPQGVDSDFELARVLVDHHDTWMADDELRLIYFDAVDHIDSDFERGRALAVVLNDEDLSAEQLERVVVLTRGMDSDFEVAKLLHAVPVGKLSDPALQKQYAAVLGDIDSDFERSKTLLHLIESRELEKSTLPVILDMVSEMDSDFEKAKVLAQVTPHLDGDPHLRESYLHTLRTIDSDFEKSKTLLRMVDEEDLEDADVLNILDMVTEIGSDFEQVKILTEIAPRVRGNDELEEAYMQVADELGSEHEYGRAMRALRRGRR